VRQELRLDADAGVGHGDLDLRLRAGERHPNAPAPRGELDRVRQQVPDGLLEPAGIAVHRTGGGIERGLQPQVLRFRRGRHRLDRGAHHLHRQQLVDVEADLAGGDAAHLEELVDQPHLQAGVAFDDVERLRELGIGGGAL
jgi:hypothetical protein